MRRLIFLLFLLIVFSSCNTLVKLIFNVRDVKKTATRQEAKIMDKKIIDKFDIEYIILFRTGKYINNTNDTALYNSKVRFFSPESVLYVQHTNYCPWNNYKDIHPDSLVLNISNAYNDSTELLSEYLVGLEYLSGDSFLSDSIKLRKYNVLMDINSWWIGPEKKRLRKISKALPNDSTLYIFINKDIIIDDDLELHNKMH